MRNHYFYDWEEQWIKSFAKKYKVSENLIKLVILIEDKRFLRHKGVDWIALARAFLRNLRFFKIKQGASTISQQVFDIVFLKSSNKVSRIKRKLLKIRGALLLEKRFSKEEIFKRYLSSVYFGKSYFGIKEASRGYFSCSPYNLALSQSFFLAERIAIPNKVKEKRIIKILRRKEISSQFSNEELKKLCDIYKKHFLIDLSKKLGGEQVGDLLSSNQ